MDNVDAFIQRLTSDPISGRHLIAIAGSVGVGKTTFANRLASVLKSAHRHPTVVSTDGFLKPNSVLDSEGLLYRKGFPESYDLEAITSFLESCRTTAQSVRVPRYSHMTFDIDGAESVELGDIVIIEGVNALQPVIADRVDHRIYLHALTPVIQKWFVNRMLGFIDTATDDSTSFYAQFVALSDSERHTFAEGVWTAINLPNLVGNIEPCRAKADWVVTFAADHSIESVVEQEL